LVEVKFVGVGHIFVLRKRIRDTAVKIANRDMVVMEASSAAPTTATATTNQTHEPSSSLPIETQSLGDGDNSSAAAETSLSPAERDWYGGSTGAAGVATEPQTGVVLAEAAEATAVPSFTSYFSQMAGMYASGGESHSINL
jgi:hypothetical protein